MSYLAASALIASIATGRGPKYWLSSLHFSNWTISARTAAAVLTLAVPLNLVIFIAVWQLAENASEI